MDESRSTFGKVRCFIGTVTLCISIVAVPFGHVAAAPPSDDPLEAVKQASVDSSEKLRSAVGVGTFEHYVQESGDKEPMLRTKGRAKVYFKQGKYHLRLDYETKLVRTVYRDMEGKKRDEKVVEWKPDREFMIYDGISASVVEFSERIRPRGCEGEVFTELQRPWRAPARLGKEEMDVVKLIEYLGKPAIQPTKLPDGAFRFTYRPKNSDKVRCEFDADPEVGFNVVATRVFNEGDELPATASRLTWKKSSGVWYVEGIEVLHDFRRLKEPGPLTRGVFKFDTMDVNVEVDPSLFSLAVTGVPIGTRFLDRRPEAPTPILYFHGGGLTPQRP